MEIKKLDSGSSWGLTDMLISMASIMDWGCLFIGIGAVFLCSLYHIYFTFQCRVQNTERFSVTSIWGRSFFLRNRSVRLSDVGDVSSYLRVTVAPSIRLSGKFVQLRWILTMGNIQFTPSCRTFIFSVTNTFWTFLHIRFRAKIINFKDCIFCDIILIHSSKTCLFYRSRGEALLSSSRSTRSTIPVWIWR